MLAGGLVAGVAWSDTSSQIAVPRPSGQVPQLQDAPGTARAGQLTQPARDAGSVGTPLRPAFARAVSPAAVPTRIGIAGLHVAAAIVPVTAAGGKLEVPDSIAEVGWWSAGGGPGAQTGTVVLDGHVDSAAAGLGALWALRSARPGQQVILGLAGGASTGYRVTAVRAYDKGNLPAALFAGPAGVQALAIITCTGIFDHTTGHYKDNLVVYAVPD